MAPGEWSQIHATLPAILGVTYGKSGAAALRVSGHRGVPMVFLMPQCRPEQPVVPTAQPISASGSVGAKVAASSGLVRGDTF